VSLCQSHSVFLSRGKTKRPRTPQPPFSLFWWEIGLQAPLPPDREAQASLPILLLPLSLMCFSVRARMSVSSPFQPAQRAELSFFRREFKEKKRPGSVFFFIQTLGNGRAQESSELNAGGTPPPRPSLRGSLNSMSFFPWLIKTPKCWVPSKSQFSPGSPI